LVQGSISVKPLKDTDIIVLGGRGSDPEITVQLVNAVAETYRNYNLVQRRQEITAIRQFVESQQQVVGERLKQSEERLQKFKEDHRIVSLDQEAQNTVQQQSYFQTMRQETKSEEEVAGKRLAYLNDLLEKEQSGLSQRFSDISSPVIINLKNTLDRLEIDRTNLLLQGVTENTPKIKALDGRIKEIRNKIKTELAALISREGPVDVIGRLQSIFESVFTLKLDLEGLQAKEQFLDSRAKEFEGQLMKLPAEQRELVQFTRDVDVDQKIYSLLSEKAEESRITEAGRLANIRIIDQARGAHQIQSKTRNTFVSGLFLGLFLAIGLVFLLEFLDTSIKNKRDLERATKTPVLVMIPDLNPPRRFHILKRQENILLYLLTHTDPKTSGAEAFRMLRTSLQYASADKPLRSLLITSPGPQEGKSTVSVNLGIVMAQAGAKTLLIDADLRRPELHRVFNCEKKPGFTDLVMMGKEGDGGILKTDVENLGFLPCGTIPPSPADFLDSKAVNSFLVRFGQPYRYVILDCAPVLAVSDTSILASKVDGAIVVVRAGKTSKNGLQETVNILTSAGVKFIGIVLNRIQPSARRYGYYYYYRYQSSEKK
jgi:capsular exopolysaccharide synthesis family protein